MDALDRRESIGVGRRTCREAVAVLDLLESGVPREIEIPVGGQAIDEQFTDASRVAVEEVEDESFEIRCLGDVHRRRARLLGAVTWTVDAGVEELGEHIILVAGEHESDERQPHLAGDVASGDVAEVARRDRERDAGSRPLLVRDPKPGGKVVDDLGEQTSPVDRVDCTNRVLALEFRVSVDGLDDVLAIVEDTVDDDVHDPRVVDRVHLRLLERRHAALRRQHEDPDVLLADHRVLRGGAGVTRRGAEDVDLFTATPELVGEQFTQQQHRHVLEGRRRAVREMHEEGAVGHLRHRHDVGIREVRRSVGPLADAAQVLVGDVLHEQGHDAVRQCGIAVAAEHPAPHLELRCVHLRVRLRQVEPAVGREAFEEDVREFRGASAPSRVVLHAPSLASCADSRPRWPERRARRRPSKRTAAARPEDLRAARNRRSAAATNGFARRRRTGSPT